MSIEPNPRLPFETYLDLLSFLDEGGSARRAELATHWSRPSDDFGAMLRHLLWRKIVGSDAEGSTFWLTCRGEAELAMEREIQAGEVSWAQMNLRPALGTLFHLLSGSLTEVGINAVLEAPKSVFLDDGCRAEIRVLDDLGLVRRDVGSDTLQAYHINPSGVAVLHRAIVFGLDR